MKSLKQIVFLSSLVSTVPCSHAYYEFVLQWGAFGTNDGRFARGPVALAVDSGNVLYVADNALGGVQKFTTQGSFLSKWVCKTNAEPLDVIPEGIAIDRFDRIFVSQAAQWASAIFLFDLQGNYLTNLFHQGSAPGEVDQPTDIVFDSSGNLLVNDSGNDRIEKFNSNGTFILTFGSDGTGDDQFQGVGGLAVDSTGNIYLADLRGKSVKKFSSTGQFILKWGGHNGDFNLPGVMAVDGLGNVVVGDSQNHRCQVFTPTGQFLSEFTYDPGAGNKPFEPYNSCIDRQGNLYVIDSANSRIVKFRLRDSVGDEIADGWRQKYFGGDGTTTNNQSCAACDPDGDGVSNLDEYRRGTVPTNAQSKNIALYANSVTGSNSYDGLAPTVAGGHGPKRDIQAAIAASITGDSVQIAGDQAAYPESVLSPGDKTITLKPVGNVTIRP